MDTASTTTSTAASGRAAIIVPAPAVPAPQPGPPSIHVRAAITWLAIFPLVATGMMGAAPLMETWHPIFRAMALTLVVVPTAVYVVLPRLFAVYGFLARRRMARRQGRTARR